MHGQAATMTQVQVRSRVLDIIADQTGSPKARISGASDLVADLGIAGDDGDDLFSAISKEFDVDWTDLDLGVIFGDEVTLPTLPWHLVPNRRNGYRYSCQMYEREHITVDDVVNAVLDGKWKQRPPRLLSAEIRQRKLAASYVFLALWAGVPAALVLGALVLKCGDFIR